jgi:putative membrane protein
MIAWILQVLVNAVILLVVANMMRRVHVRNFGTALVVALIIGLLSMLLMWLLVFILNVATLGLFFFMGLGFVIRVFAFAIVIEITDKISSGFTTDGFWPSLWLAIILAIVGAALDGILF